MTERVVLHVGAPKSGTTYLQSVLAANADRLAQAGVELVGRERVDLVHAAMVIREDPRLESLPPRASTAWDRLRSEIAAGRGHTALLSYELLAGASQDQAARAIGDLGEYDVEVVVTGRDLARAVASAWQERLKFALTTPFEDWQPPAESVRRSEWGWRTLDPSGVASRWGHGLVDDKVHLVTVPRGGGAGVLWRRFADACGLAEVDVVPPDARSNESLGVAAAEVLRRVNELVTAPVEGNREHAVWLRDLLAHEVLAPLDDEPFGMTDAHLAAAEAQFERCRVRLAKHDYRWHGELEDLRPARREGRTPGEVPAERQRDVAVRAIWELLLRLREETSSHPEPIDQDGLARRVLSGPARSRIARRQRQLEDKLRELDQSLAESRRLQYRLAMVTDVVGILLLPYAEQDEEPLVDFVRRYRPEAL